MFLTESWFWRGTQSAIFYYVSCSPCLEYKHKRNRRREAIQSEKEKADIIMTQPGMIVQPGPFQTNPDWAEEIIRGPGPPKGWKKDKILQGYSESERERYRTGQQAYQLGSASTALPLMDVYDGTAEAVDEPVRTDIDVDGQSEPLQRPTLTPSQPPENPSRTSEAMSSISDQTSDAIQTSSKSSSEQPGRPSRPGVSMERRLSTAVDNLRDTIKGWNFRRYDREDEILLGVNERLSRMWDRATNHGAQTGNEGRRRSFAHGRRRAGTTTTNESDGYDYQRAVRNPEINELHPPTVSQLPATRDEAVWMLLPPPSAAVMAGRLRPQDEPALRWPLATIGRTEREWQELKALRQTAEADTVQRESRDSDAERTPDLSNSSSEVNWSDEDDDKDRHEEQQEKRHSAPVLGWVPLPTISKPPMIRAASTGRGDHCVW